MTDYKLTEQHKCQCGCGGETNFYRGKYNAFITGHNGSHHDSYKRIYGIWRGMKQRCLDANAANYKNYGGKGITICKEWLEYQTFKEWAINNGYSDTLQIDRKDNTKGYSPENCKFSTPKQQLRNTSFNRIITAFGENKLLCEWAEDIRCIVKPITFINRIRMGWLSERALTQPAGRNIRWNTN